MSVPCFTLSCARVRGKRSNVSYPDDRTVHNLAELLAAAQFDHTPGGFAGGQRSAANWRCTECVVLDVDNDYGGEVVTPATICRDFPDVAHYIVYSRHHNQQKDGKLAVPRFHVYFPVGLLTDATEVAGLLEAVTARYRYFDDACKDLGRFYFGVPHPQGEAVSGSQLLDEFMTRQSAPTAQNAPAALPAAGEVPGNQIPAGQRNATLSAFAFAVLRRYGANGVDAARTAFLQRATQCDPPLSDGELSAVWNNAVKAAPAKIWSAPGYLSPDEYAAQGFPVEVLTLKLSDLSDVAEGVLFAENTAGALLWNASVGWLAWDGCRFTPDDSKVRLLAQSFTGRQLHTAQSDYQQAAGSAAKDPENAELTARAKKAKALLDFTRRCRSSVGIDHLLKEAAPRLACAVDELDADPFCLNTPAGIVDLRTGDVHPTDPAARCTKLTSVAPGTDGEEMWRSFLDTVTCGDAELADYLQTVAGMAALGRVYTETLLIATGDGGNGKSTFFNTLARVLGDYAAGISPDLLLTGNRGNVGAEVAALRGCRLVLAAETEEGQRLDSATVKRLCSTDSIAANPKYRAPFCFVPSHTLVLYTNFLPRVGSSDRGTWARLTVLPFNAHLRNTAGERKDFAEVLFAQAGGAALAWIIEGARRFIANGYTLHPPAAVCDALEGYRKSCDWLGAFLSAEAERGDGYAVGSRDLYQRYSTYCQENGEYRRDSRDFKNALQSAGFECKHTMKGGQYSGLRLRSDFSPK